MGYPGGLFKITCFAAPIHCPTPPRNQCTTFCFVFSPRGSRLPSTPNNVNELLFCFWLRGCYYYNCCHCPCSCFGRCFVIAADVYTCSFLLGHAVLYAQSKHPHAPTRTLAALGERLRARAHVQFGRKGITGKRAHRDARACGWAGLRVCAFNFSTCRHDRTEGLARTTRTGRAK